jgi:hypothetical protein
MKPAILIFFVLCLLLPSCKSKRDKCASVIGLMRTEARATDAMVKGKAGDRPAAQHAKLLEETAKELRGLDFKDQKLTSAIQSYIGALGALGELKPGAEDLAATLTYLESSRRRVADECNR